MEHVHSIHTVLKIQWEYNKNQLFKKKITLNHIYDISLKKLLLIILQQYSL